MLKGLQGKNVVKVIGIEVIQSISLSLSVCFCNQVLSSCYLLLIFIFYILILYVVWMMSDDIHEVLGRVRSGLGTCCFRWLIIMSGQLIY